MTKIKTPAQYEAIIAKHESEISRLNSLIEKIRGNRVNEVHGLKKELSDSKKKNKDKNFTIKSLEKTVEKLRETILDQKNTISYQKKELAEKDEKNASLENELAVRKRRSESSRYQKLQQISDAQRDQNHIKKLQSDYELLQDQIEDYDIRIQELQSRVKKSEKIIEDNFQKEKAMKEQLSRTIEIFVRFLELHNNHSNYSDQATQNFRSRHLVNPSSLCEFEIAKNDELCLKVLSQFGTQAKERCEQIFNRGYFEAYTVRRTVRSSVNTVVFGNSLDLDIRQATTGYLFSFKLHNPQRMVRDQTGKINHMTS